MGVIARALHLDLERRWRSSSCAASCRSEEDIVARLKLEARAVARMRSEHVARVLDVGRLESGVPYIVMEYLEGKDLWTILREKGRISRPLAVDYAVQACEALAEAHALGIVHRDIKPENLFLSESPDGAAIVKLLDFGISKQKNLRFDGSITGQSTAVGSPHYMAPEQMRAESNIDARADIWAMGVILYELVSGISPFDAESMPEICARVVDEQPPRLAEMDPEIPDPLDALIFRCLEKDRKQRPADVAELATALAPFGTPDTPQRAERIARIVSGAAARAGEQRKAGSRTSSIGTGNRVRCPDLVDAGRGKLARALCKTARHAPDKPASRLGVGGCVVRRDRCGRVLRGAAPAAGGGGGEAGCRGNPCRGSAAGRAAERKSRAAARAWLQRARRDCSGHGLAPPRAAPSTPAHASAALVSAATRALAPRV
jgi:serine/threonine-protein kinase